MKLIFFFSAPDDQTRPISDVMEFMDGDIRNDLGGFAGHSIGSSAGSSEHGNDSSLKITISSRSLHNEHINTLVPISLFVIRLVTIYLSSSF